LRRLCSAGFFLSLVAGCGVEPAATTNSAGSTGGDQTLQDALRVERVVDGDTIVVDIFGSSQTVRIKGIDTPERSFGSEKPSEPFAELAYSFTEQMTEGDGGLVELGFDSACPEPAITRCVDTHGRLLAYVKLADGRDLGE
jgi:micrococcal nuclease